MNMTIEHPTSRDMSFKSCLYKMQTDQLNFEAFEELFDNDDMDEIPDEPSFDSEWRCAVSGYKSR